MRRQHLWTSVAAAVAALLVTGCGSNSGTGGSSSGGNAAPANKAVKIGLASPLTGPAASAGLAMDCGIQAFLEAKNAQGGINGYTFTFDEKDSKYDPATTAGLVRDFATSGVFAVATVGTAPMQAAVPVLKPKNIPLFAQADGGDLTPPPWEGVFGVNPQYSKEAASAADFIANTLKQKQASIVYLGSAAGKPAGDAFGPAFSKFGGSVAVSDGIPTTTTDFAPYAQKLKQANAPVVYAFVLDTMLASLQKAAAAIGYTPTWVTWSPAYTSSYLKLVGNLAQGLYLSEWTTPETQTDEKAVQQYRADIGKKCPNLVSDTALKTGYTLGAAIGTGVEKATQGGKSLTPDGFIKALSIKSQPLGLTPKVTYDSSTHAGTSANSYWQVTSPTGDIKKITEFTDLPAS